jgi:hypothetical protein
MCTGYGYTIRSIIIIKYSIEYIVLMLIVRLVMYLMIILNESVLLYNKYHVILYLMMSYP